MHESRICPGCRAELPADAPEGLCPLCRAERAARETAYSNGGDSQSTTQLLDDLPPCPPGPLPEPAVHETAGRYSQVGEHSRGGMGRILLVHDQTIGREVALKELLPQPGGSGDGTPARQSAATVARFLQEARLTGQLEHPSIVPVYELGRRADGRLYYTMKLVRGKTLRNALAEKKTLGGRLELLPHVVDLCQAIAYAHSRGVIHRDLKPDNVMVGEFGETVVIDWGLVKARGQEETNAADMEQAGGASAIAGGDPAVETVDGVAIGTPAYMPPEQAAGDLKQVDERSDVYALGAVLYELLSGRPPYTGQTPFEVIWKVQREAPPPLRQIERRVAPELAAICARAMARDPADRYASAKELADDLQSFISGRVFTEREARLSFVAAFYIFGAALLAAGAGALAYCNWENIPRPIRVVLLFAAVAALYVSGASFAKRRVRKSHRAEALMVLGTLMLGASIFLTAHIYALDGLMRHGFGWWALGAMAAAYAGRSSPSGIIALVAAYAWFLQRTQEVAPAALWWFPPLAAAATLPLAYARDSRSLSVGAMLLIGASSAHVTFDNGAVLRLCLAVVACAALFFPWGLLSYASERWRKFAGPAVALAVASLAATLLPLGSMRASQFLATELIPGRDFHALQLLPVGLACAVAAAMWCLAAARGFVWPEMRVLASAFLTACALLLAVVALGETPAHASEGGSTPSEWVAFVMATSAAIVLGGGTAWAGVALLNRSIFNVGTLLNVLAAIHCAVEMNASLQIKAMIMVAAGFAVIFAGTRFESHLNERR